jgi:hypothetical protein
LKKVRNFVKTEKFREKKCVEKSEKFLEILRKMRNFVKSGKFRAKMRKKRRNISINFSMCTQKKSGEPLGFIFYFQLNIDYDIRHRGMALI